MALYQPRHVSAQAAYDALAAAYPGGYDWYAWAHAAGLTPGQLAYAQGLLREVLQTANGEPLIYKDSDEVYKLAASRLEADIYVLKRLRDASTRLFRTLQTMKATDTKFGVVKSKRQVTKLAKRLVEDLDDLMTLY
jgi:hypothetical protein